ncbi:hypothetical protein ACFE04_015257 [Oxalis oulophora]
MARRFMYTILLFFEVDLRSHVVPRGDRLPPPIVVSGKATGSIHCTGRFAPAQSNSASQQVTYLENSVGVNTFDFACPPLTSSGSHPWFSTCLRFLHGWAFLISASSDLGPVSPGAVNFGFIDLGLVSAQGRFSASTPCFAHSHDVQADLGVFARSRDVGRFDISMSRRLRSTTSLVSVLSRHPYVTAPISKQVDSLTSTSVNPIPRHRVDGLSSARHPSRYQVVIPTSLLPLHLCITTLISAKQQGLGCPLRDWKQVGVEEKDKMQRQLKGKEAN